IVVTQHRAPIHEQFHQLKRWAFARIIDVLLVRDAEDQNLAAANRPSGVVERLGHSIDDIERHAGVDLAGQLDEPRDQAMLPGNPTEVERIDGDTMSAEAGSREEGLKSERLRLGRVDDFPDVDSDAVEEHLQLIDHRDVHRTISVFQNLAGLSYLAVRDR